MGARIRKLAIREYEPFMRFIERCYGASPGTFERLYPHRFRPTAELCDATYVMERDGRIVSHVGLYPLEMHVQGIVVPVGGIGAVGTEASERGKGHMAALLWHAVDEMRARGHVLSWLSGDRARYKAFGWECVPVSYELSFSRRSLGRCGA